jgi:hypothetical protein
MPSKGGSLNAMERDFENYKNEMGGQDLVLYRGFKKKFWKFWKWRDYLFNPVWNYPYWRDETL